MFKPQDRVFVVAYGKVRSGVVVHVDYSGDFLLTSLIELDDTTDGKFWQTARHETIHPYPEVGMGATAGYGGDSYPYTIVSVSKSGRQIEVQRDEATYIGPERKYGDEPNKEDWKYTPIPDSHKYTVKLNRKGKWVGVGGYCGLGYRRYRQDPHF